MKPTVEMVQRLMDAAGYLLDLVATAKSDPSAIAAVTLGLVERIGTYGPSISLVPFDGVSEIGRWQDGDGMWFADRFQVLIDCYAGTARMPEQADALIQMWNRAEATSG